MAIIDIRGASLTTSDPPISTNPNADLAWKAPVRAATIGSNITLSGQQTLDGVSLNVGDRVLVKDQTDQTTNGIYNVQTGPWTRTIDANNNSQWAQGLQVAVTSGGVNASTSWRLTTVNPITLGTSLIVFIFALTPPTSGGVDWFNVKLYGAKGDGVTDDTAAITSAITALNGSGGGTLYFPLGTYMVSSALVISSNTRVTGDGWDSIIKATSGIASYAPFATITGATGWFLITNNSYNSGNSNITIDNLGFDFSNVSGAQAGASHAIQFYNATHCGVSDCHFNQGGDGVAFTHSSYFHAYGNHIIGTSDAALDIWDNCTDGVLFGNTIDVQNATNGYGIVFTGINTQNVSGTTKRIKVIGNTVRNANLTGIWSQGGSDGVSNTGTIEDCLIEGNTIDSCLIGIRVSQGFRTAVIGNNISNSQQQGIAFAAELNQAGANCTVVGNTVDGSSAVGAGSYAAIDLQNTATSNIVAHNNVTGSNHSYGIAVDSGATFNTVVDNIVSAGTLGTIANLGSPTNAVSGLPGIIRFAIAGVNFNSAHTDNAVPIGAGTARYQVDRVTISNASASISSATVGVFTSTGGGGSTVAADQSITVTQSGGDTGNDMQNLTVTNGAIAAYDVNTLYVRVGTAEGSAATADVIIFIRPLT